MVRKANAIEAAKSAELAYVCLAPAAMRASLQRERPASNTNVARASVLGEGVEVEAVERNQNDLSGFIEILTVDLQLAQDLRE